MRKILVAALLGACGVRYVTEADTAAAGAPDAPAQTTTIIVPTEHQSLFERLKALLEQDATWVKDNVEGGLTMLEGMFKEKQAAAEEKAD